jgi:hypothetical protein
VRPRTHTDHEGTVTRSKVDRRGGACGKFRYSSKKIALSSAREQRALTGENIRVYHCYPCHCYHLGHPPGEPRRLSA